MDEKRLFIAVDISESIRNDLRNKVYGNDNIGKLRWVKYDSLHITLKFLGNVKTGDILKIEEVMKSAAAGKGEVTLDYTGLGLFPGLERPRVLWIGFEDKSGVLRNVARELEDGLDSELGIKKERRPFTPHLTLARVKGDVNHVKLSEFVKNGVDLTEGSFSISEIVLYESELTRSGAIYTRIFSAPLK